MRMWIALYRETTLGRVQSIELLADSPEGAEQVFHDNPRLRDFDLLGFWDGDSFIPAPKVWEAP